MTPQELKNSILQLAIQGKLVEQRPEEGTAEELYQQTQAEKQKLIKEGKIKKDKPLPEITEEEKPFDIPDSWRWVRVRDCISNRAGLAYDKTNLNIHSDNMIRVLRGGNISEMAYSQKPDDVFISQEFVKPDLFLKKNTIITPAVTSLEHIGKMGRIERDYEDMVVGGFVLMLIPHISVDTFSQYLLSTFSSKYFRDCCRGIVNKSGQAFYNLSRDKMMGLIIPLPPLAEQRRIVAKVEEVLPLIDRYEKAWTRLEEFNKRFPDDLQKSILQMAIQGKLVEQLASDENVDELLLSIKKKREALIQTGRLKKLGKINKTTDVEIEIPDAWRLTHLFELINKRVDNRGKTPLHTSVKSDRDYIDLLEINAIVPGASIDHQKVEKYINEETYSSLRGYVEEGDILIATVGSVGKFAMMDASKSAIAQNIIGIRCFDEINQKYIFYLIQSPYFYESMGSIKMEAVQASIKVPDLMNLYVPIPPLSEQKRIVARLEELLPLCQKLRACIFLQS